MGASRGPARALIIGLSNVGDAVLTADVIAAVRQALPEAHLALLVGSRAKPLFEGDPRIQTLVDLDRYASPAGRCRLLVSLWRYRPDVVVDLRATVYPLLLKPWSAWRYLRRPPRALRHMRDRHAWMLRAQAPGLARWLPAAAPPRDGFWCSAKDQAHVEQLLRRWGVDEGAGLAVIAPGARSHIKRWTADGYARVADRLIADHRLPVVFTGEPAEEEVVEAVLARMERRAHSAVGLLTARQLGALMGRARLVITNDSGALHLASLVNAPTVAVFGPTDPARYGPRAARARVVRRALFCAPCERPLCRFQHECMRFVAADEVYAAAAALLAAAPVAPAQGPG